MYIGLYIKYTNCISLCIRNKKMKLVFLAFRPKYLKVMTDNNIGNASSTKNTKVVLIRNTL